MNMSRHKSWGRLGDVLGRLRANDRFSFLFCHAAFYLQRFWLESLSARARDALTPAPAMGDDQVYHARWNSAQEGATRSSGWRPQTWATDSSSNNAWNTRGAWDTPSAWDTASNAHASHQWGYSWHNNDNGWWGWRSPWRCDAVDETRANNAPPANDLSDGARRESAQDAPQSQTTTAAAEAAADGPDSASAAELLDATDVAKQREAMNAFQAKKDDANEWFGMCTGFKPTGGSTSSATGQARAGDASAAAAAETAANAGDAAAVTQSTSKNGVAKLKGPPPGLPPPSVVCLMKAAALKPHALPGYNGPCDRAPQHLDAPLPGPPPKAQEPHGAKQPAVAAAAATAGIQPRPQGHVPVPNPRESLGVKVLNASGGREFDVDFFLGYKNFRGHYKQHNQCLKWWRFTQEVPDNPFHSPPKVFDNVKMTSVATVVHGTRTNFSFDQTRMVPWTWLEMVAQLRDDDIRAVVAGTAGECRLVGCCLAVRPGSYDVKRHYHDRIESGETQQMMKKPVWDFVLFRTDGSGLRMHPSWSERKVVCWPVEAHACRVEPPPAGLGRSAGRGTFRAYAFMDCKLELRFDYRKDKLP